ncbi:helix-turn-helix domain-containing protein [Solihabitans fulvus]|uniref:Helix-turn-helix domain-containing protein n=1 Tax=Solihabitans fulvus TaxID=1892852 RepID=A0A5B2WHF0_9PSEU|nr:helix-turn-helix transcriptional regulator [Solihabitans fulvus]KAA2250170.1 helix-turn-helix domain-containing protein [Solihabitans fulvus]
MTTRNDPSALRWLIGVELTNFRKQANSTPTQVLEATGISKSKLSSMENGRYQQHPDDMAKLLHLYGAERRDVDRLASLAGSAEGRTWWAPWSNVVADWFKTFVGLEGLAEAEFVFQPMVLPGLLQTEEYAESITESTGFVRRDHSDRFASFRVARAKRLIEPEPLRLHAVIGEAALRLRVGSPETRRAQREHLIRLARQPNITIQVLRPEDGPHTAGTGSFVVLDFAQAQSIAYAEHLDGAVYGQDQDDVRTYKMAAENVQSVAAAPDKSLSLIRALAGGS